MTPVVPNIKVEPSNYLDVDLGVNNDENRHTNHEGKQNLVHSAISLFNYKLLFYKVTQNHFDL